MVQKSLFSIFVMAVYVFGVVLAKGFWSTLAAVLIPFWSYYLVAEWAYLKYLM